jgi:hypothetical protein
MVAELFKKLFVALVFVSAVGCANLPDMKRIQGNMDQMVGYMGVMAYNTSQMAAAADNMQRKSDQLMANLNKKGASAERAIQNYSQAVLDNDRAAIRNLQGIREELGQLRQNLRQPAGTSEGPRDQATVASMQNKLNELEKRLAVVISKIEKLDAKTP